MQVLCNNYGWLFLPHTLYLHTVVTKWWDRELISQHEQAGSCGCSHCLVLRAGTQKEEEMYVRLIDAATKQVIHENQAEEVDT